MPAISGHTHPSTTLPRHILVGYWHNWQAEAASFIRLKDISPAFDVINIAFASPAGADGVMDFAPCSATTPEQFKSDLDYLHRQGKKVLISAGGANGSVEISNTKAQQNFAESMASIVERYGFDGIDINLEGKVTLLRGDMDFRKPNSPSITNLIGAIRTIQGRFGPGFIVTIAPETISVQGGYHDYDGVWGAYLPVIHGLRDILTYVHVQHYNSAAMRALDGKMYLQGTADFHVSMAEMLLQGFPIKGDANNVFPGLNPEQIVIGLPSLVNSNGDGYTVPVDVRKTLEYLAKGISFQGRYQLRYPSGYPGFRGVMTWSINWDAVNRFQFSSTTRSFLDALP